MKISLPLSISVAVVGLVCGVAWLRDSREGAPNRASASNVRSDGHGFERTSNVRQDPATPFARSSEASELANLRRELAQLKAEMKVLRGQSLEPDPGDQPDPAEEEARLRKERREYLQDLAENFPNELVDRGWASETQDVIADALESNGLGASALGVECRSETCRVEVAIGSPQDVHAMSMFVLGVGQALPKVDYDQTDDGEGNRRTVMYMSRYDNPPEDVEPQP